MSGQHYILSFILVFICVIQAPSLKVERSSKSVQADAEEYLQFGVHHQSQRLEKWGSAQAPAVVTEKLSSSDGLLMSNLLRDHLQATGKTRFRKDGTNASQILLAMLALWVGISIALLLAPWGRAGCSDGDVGASRPLGSPRTMQAPKVRPPQAVPPVSESFQRRYAQSVGEERQALELLRRCNIISQEEISSNSVSPEHIDECIWVAMQMLKQKPLEVWVALNIQEGQQSFRDTVAQIYSAREQTRVNVYDGVYPPGMDPPRPRSRQSPDLSPSGNDYSPGESARSLRKDGSAISLGSDVSFKAEEGGDEPGPGTGRSGLSVSEMGTAPPTILSNSTVPATLPQMPPPTLPQNPMRTQALANPVSSLNFTNQVEYNEPPSGQASVMASASSLGDYKDYKMEEGAFASVLTPNSSNAVSQRESPAKPDSLGKSASSQSSGSPAKEFRFAPKEVMKRPPPDLPCDQNLLPASPGTSPLTPSVMPAAVARRLASSPNLASTNKQPLSPSRP